MKLPVNRLTNFGPKGTSTTKSPPSSASPVKSSTARLSHPKRSRCHWRDLTDLDYQPAHKGCYDGF